MLGILCFRSSKNHRCNWQLIKPALHKFLSLSMAISQFGVLELPYTHFLSLETNPRPSAEILTWNEFDLTYQ